MAASDNILKQDIIAGHLKVLYTELRELKRARSLQEREGNLGGTERPNNNDFTGELRFTFDAVLVTSLTGDLTFRALRTIASTLNSPGWVTDPEFSSKFITVNVPHNAQLPAVDDVVPAFFTGLIGQAPAIPVPRYGTFGIGVGKKWFVVVNVNKDVLECREWDFDTNAAIVPSPDPGLFRVAKPWELRGSTWAGTTISSVFYSSTDGTAEIAGHTTREGVDSSGSPTITENQLIIPIYIESVVFGSVIRVESEKTGVTFVGSVVYWQDTNNGSRAWSQVSSG